MESVLVEGLDRRFQNSSALGLPVLLSLGGVRNGDFAVAIGEDSLQMWEAIDYTGRYISAVFMCRLSVHLEVSGLKFIQKEFPPCTGVPQSTEGPPKIENAF